MRSALAIIACLAVLGLVDYSIAEKERLLETGKVVYLELAPVDPRSLMQGDYMMLRFKIANDAMPAMGHRDLLGGSRIFGGSYLASADGRMVATLDPNAVATYRRLDDGTPLAANEVLLRYRVREGQLKFATNAFFFQEGTANKYAGARYGEFRVAPDGGLLLTGLRSQDLQPLQ
jgi:uncharacterized membrane-anchored protein